MTYQEVVKSWSHIILSCVVSCACISEQDVWWWWLTDTDFCRLGKKGRVTKWPVKLCVGLRFLSFFCQKNMTFYVWVVAHVFSNTALSMRSVTITTQSRYNLKSHKYVCIATYQPDTKSNHNSNPNPNTTTKQHAIAMQHSTKLKSHVLRIQINSYETRCTFWTLCDFRLALSRCRKRKYEIPLRQGFYVQDHEVPGLEVDGSHEEGGHRERKQLMLHTDAVFDAVLDVVQRQLGSEDDRRIPEQQRLGHWVVLEQLHHRHTETNQLGPTVGRCTVHRKPYVYSPRDARKKT